LWCASSRGFFVNRLTTLNRAIEDFAVVDYGEALVDAWQGGKVGLQTFHPLEEIKAYRPVFLAAIDYDVKVLRAPNPLANDFIRLPHRRSSFEILNEI